MYNLHCHSLLSDGALLPSEVAVRYLALGYKAIAITDHADYSNINSIINAIVEFTSHWPKDSKIQVLPGIELTHLPPAQFKPLAKHARREGIKVIVAHGETLIEPVIKGTNRAALEADIDILAHPGLISDEDTKLAAKRGVFLEITSRKGHSDTNPCVVEKSLKFNARMILNNDSHEPEDIVAFEEIEKIGYAAGLGRKDIDRILDCVGRFVAEKNAIK
jgi:histidinol phosphatase-like PHP family hydrolase